MHHRSVAFRNWIKSYKQGAVDLTPADFFLCGPIEGQSVQKYTPHSKTATRQEIPAVNVNTMGKIFQNLEKRIQVFLDVKGDQFQH